jgi:hypothetical protein
MKMKRFASLALVLLTASGCGDPFEHSPCRVHAVSEFASPNGNFRAVRSERTCKPDVQKTLETRVSLISSSANESDSGEIVFMVAGKPNLNVIWQDPTHLLIECPGVRREDVILDFDSYQGIAVSYKFE